MVNNQFKAFGIKLNILQVNGMTQFNMPSLLSVFEGTIFECSIDQQSTGCQIARC